MPETVAKWEAGQVVGTRWQGIGRSTITKHVIDRVTKGGRAVIGASQFTPGVGRELGGRRRIKPWSKADERDWQAQKDAAELAEQRRATAKQEWDARRKAIEEAVTYGKSVIQEHVQRYGTGSKRADLCIEILGKWGQTDIQ